MATPTRTMPAPRTHTFDQRGLNGEGASAWRHEVWVPLPGEPGVPAGYYDRLDLEDPRCTWTETHQDPGTGEWSLVVVRYTAAPVLTEVEFGQACGELAEAWWSTTQV